MDHMEHMNPYNIHMDHMIWYNLVCLSRAGRQAGRQAGRLGQATNKNAKADVGYAHIYMYKRHMTTPYVFYA